MICKIIYAKRDILVFHGKNTIKLDLMAVRHLKNVGAGATKGWRNV